MSEEILKVFLDDLKTIRVACQNCHIVLELDVQTIQNAMRLNQCPSCKHDFTLASSPTPHGYLPLHELAKVFKYLESVKDRVKIEFPVKIVK